MRLMGKVALITGSSSGIGRASALLFSQEGARISVVDIDRKGGEQTVELIKQKGGEALFIEVDVSRASEVKMSIEKTVGTFGKLDILFNNAGVPMSFTPIEEVDEVLWDKNIDINLKSIFLTCKYTVPVMKNQGKGVIINTGSISGVRPRPCLSAYNASKGGVISLTQSLAIELASSNIRVNCINPVATETPMLSTIKGKKVLEDEDKRAYISSIPLGRLGKPEDIAYAALYLASDESSMVTGIYLNVDGGRGI